MEEQEHARRARIGLAMMQGSWTKAKSELQQTTAIDTHLNPNLMWAMDQAVLLADRIINLLDGWLKEQESRTSAIHDGDRSPGPSGSPNGGRGSERP